MWLWEAFWCAIGHIRHATPHQTSPYWGDSGHAQHIAALGTLKCSPFMSAPWATRHRVHGCPSPFSPCTSRRSNVGKAPERHSTKIIHSGATVEPDMRLAHGLVLGETPPCCRAVYPYNIHTCTVDHLGTRRVVHMPHGIRRQAGYDHPPGVPVPRCRELTGRRAAYTRAHPPATGVCAPHP